MSNTTVMSFNQFFEMERGNISLQEILEENNIQRLDKIAGKILKDEKLRRFCVTCIAASMMTFKAYAEDASATQAMAKVGAASSKVIGIIQFSIGKICIIACILEIGKSLIAKRREEIPQVGMKYFIAYLVVKVLPWLFTLIDETFA